MCHDCDYATHSAPKADKQMKRHVRAPVIGAAASGTAMEEETTEPMAWSNVFDKL
jgi:hypothetical protein